MAVGPLLGGAVTSARTRRDWIRVVVAKPTMNTSAAPLAHETQRDAAGRASEPGTAWSERALHGKVREIPVQIRSQRGDALVATLRLLLERLADDGFHVLVAAHGPSAEMVWVVQ